MKGGEKKCVDFIGVLVTVVVVVLLVVVVEARATLLCESGGECEVNEIMLCKNPYMKIPEGVSGKGARLSREGRLAATPFPCGQCLPCRIQKQREWKNRLMLENLTVNKSAFVTLTYSDECIPEDGGLKKQDYQNYLKRLRNYVSPGRFRYFGVGEYGSKTLRPHYHFMFFGLGIEDTSEIKKAWRKEGGEEIGHVLVGDVTPASCEYICKYAIKRMTVKGKDFYERYPWMVGKELEFMTSSKGKGGIGIDAVRVIGRKYKTDKRFPKDRITRELKFGKKKLPLGRYLTEKLRKELGVSNIVKEKELYEYQERLLGNHMDCDGVYYENLVVSGEQKRKRQSARNKIFNQKGSI